MIGSQNNSLFKKIIIHCFLIVSVFVLLLPVLHMISGGFRANQSMYSPLIDLNTWVDRSIVNREESRISKRVLYKKIERALPSEDTSPSKEEKERLVLFQKALKRWIFRNGKEKEKEALLEAYQTYQTAYFSSEDQKKELEDALFWNRELRYHYETRVSLVNYRVFFTGIAPDRQEITYPILRWFGNSMLIASVVMLVQVCVVLLAAFAITRYRFTGRKAVVFFIVVLQVFPSSMTMIALYLLLDYLGGIVPQIGLDTIPGLIFVYLGAGIPLNIWLSKGYFATLPTSLEESAMVDGASLWQIFSRIIFPLVTPVAAVVGILSFIAAYNEFLLATFLITKPENFTLPVGLDFFIYSDTIRYGMFCAISVIGSLPILAMWLFLQKYIVAGLTHSAVK